MLDMAITGDGENRAISRVLTELDMKKFTSMLLDVWREACRHIEIGECTGLIAPLLAEHLPADLVLVRRIDLYRGCIETAAAGASTRAAAPARLRDDVTPDQMEQLLTWCRRGQIVSSRSTARAPEAALFLPHGGPREFITGPLAGPEGPIGVLILMSARRA